MDFKEKYNSSVDRTNSLLCVGLDSDVDTIPIKFNGERKVYNFNRYILEEVSPYISAVKINTAFYEARGSIGLRDLELTCQLIITVYPDLPLIIDAKRGDIGSTNKGYVKLLDSLKADAMTLNPYLGSEALSPFLERSDKGFFILCKTSNQGSGEFQDLIIIDDNGFQMKLYEKVARNVLEWNLSSNNCMLVVGAKYPDVLKNIRGIVGDMIILVPGLGAQGGDAEATIRAGIDQNRKGIIVNSSRDIILSEKPSASALKMKNLINRFR